MIPTKRVRRTVAALAVSAAMLLAAACGSDEGGDGDSSDASPSGPVADDASPSGPVAEISGKPGEQPDIQINGEAGVGRETVSEALSEGDGAEITEGAFLRLDVLARTVESDAELLNTWASGQNGEQDDGEGSQQLRQQIVSQAGVESYLPSAVTEPLIGKQVGSRVQVEGRATELFGEAVAQQYGFSQNEGVVWVLDVAAALEVNLRGEAQGEQAAVEEGMPEVDASGKKPASFTIPEGQDPPEELRQQVLIEGDGPEVQAGQALAVQYTGVLWADGKKFDSSWDRDSASAFQIGTGSVVPGWDEGLVGKHVGDRVLLVIPPDMGYGDEDRDTIPGGSTLVFVVDILGAA